jgi:hypothetical protein
LQTCQRQCAIDDRTRPTGPRSRVTVKRGPAPARVMRTRHRW